MRAVVQRVDRASVTVDEKITGEVQKGLLVLLGVAEGDKVNIVALDKAGKPTQRRLNDLVVVVIEMADRSAATYFPESNDLLDLDNFDQTSGIPAYKNIPVLIEKAAA